MNRIRLLRLKSALRQDDFAKKIHVSQSSLSGYENGKYEPDCKLLLKIADFFGVTVDYLLGRDCPSLPEGGAFKKVPVYGRVGDNLQEKLSCVFYSQEESSPPTAQQDGEYFGMYMNSDCMEPRIRMGDLIIAHKQQTISKGDIVVIQIGHSDATIKKVVKLKSGDMFLVSYNPKYKLESFSAREVLSLPIRILGKVVEFRGKC